MPRFAFTITGSVHLDDPQLLRAVGGPTFTVDGHDVQDAGDASEAIEVLLHTTLRTGMSEAFGHRKALGPINVNVVQVSEPDQA